MRTRTYAWFMKTCTCNDFMYTAGNELISELIHVNCMVMTILF